MKTAPNRGGFLLFDSSLPILCLHYSESVDIVDRSLGNLPKGNDFIALFVN